MDIIVYYRSSDPMLRKIKPTSNMDYRGTKRTNTTLLSVITVTLNALTFWHWQPIHNLNHLDTWCFVYTWDFVKWKMNQNNVKRKRNNLQKSSNTNNKVLANGKAKNGFSNVKPTNSKIIFDDDGNEQKSIKKKNLKKQRSSFSANQTDDITSRWYEEVSAPMMLLDIRDWYNWIHHFSMLRTIQTRNCWKWRSKKWLNWRTRVKHVSRTSWPKRRAVNFQLHCPRWSLNVNQNFLRQKTPPIPSGWKLRCIKERQRIVRMPAHCWCKPIHWETCHRWRN